MTTEMDFDAQAENILRALEKMIDPAVRHFTVSEALKQVWLAAEAQMHETEKYRFPANLPPRKSGCRA